MNKKKGKIYKITNLVTGGLYIGCTINPLKKRFDEHSYRCYNTDYSSKLYNSMRKHGIENFEITLITECELDVLYETEKQYIKKFDTYKNGLNSTFGGEGCLGYTHTDEIRIKISNNLKNGNSHKNKTYEELYGDMAEEERNKRKLSVKKNWELMEDEKKLKRIENIKSSLLKKSKFNEEMVEKMRVEIMSGVKFKTLKKEYPELTSWLYYSLKNNQR